MKVRGYARPEASGFAVVIALDHLPDRMETRDHIRGVMRNVQIESWVPNEGSGVSDRPAQLSAAQRSTLFPENANSKNVKFSSMMAFA